MAIVLTNNAKFTPYTFEELIKPYAMYTQEYNTLEENLYDLSSKAELMKAYANSEPDSKVANMYNNYAKDLEKQRDILSSQGLARGRQGLLDLKRRYASEIVPIEQAFKYRSALAEEQRKLRASNPTIMYDIDFSSEVSLEDLINNPSLSYNAVSGDDLYKRGKEAAISASSRLENEITPVLGQQYWQIRQGYGVEAANAFLLDQSNIPELKQAVERIVSQSGVSSNNLSRATDYAISGIMAGLSQDINYQANRGYHDAHDIERHKWEKQRQEWMEEDRKIEAELREEREKGMKLPNGNRLRFLGGGRAIEINEKDGTWKFVTPSSSDGKQITIDDVAKVSDTPVIVANTTGVWRASEEGEDVSDTFLGMTRSNVVSMWGNYTLDDMYKKGNIVTDLTTIPTDAAIKIKQEAKERNLDLEKYSIIQVKAEEKRARGNYDYILMPTNLIELDKFVESYE